MARNRMYLGLSLALIGTVAGCQQVAGVSGSGAGDIGENVSDSGARDDESPSNGGSDADGGAPGVDDDGARGSGAVTFSLTDGHVYRQPAELGSAAEDITERLDELSPRAVDEWLNISPDGETLLVSTERFDPQCAGFACLVLLNSDVSESEVIRANGEVVRAQRFGAVASGGDLVVFPADGGPHALDLWAVRRAGNGWTAPELLTGESAHDFNHMPAISDDGRQVVFDCGPDPFGLAGTGICLLETSRAGFEQLLAPQDNPPGFGAGTALHSPDFAPDGSIVFEADWGGELIWRLRRDGADPFPVAMEDTNDNSPCVLPDGRIASIWLNRPGSSGLHELKVVDGDGSGRQMLLTEQDIVDAGMGCGGSPASAQPTGGRYFPDEAIWYQEVSDAPLDAESDEIISFLESAGGFGLGRVQIDFSIEVLEADADTPFVGFVPTDDFFEPDCDLVEIPLPSVGAIEGESGYECTQDGDCHLIVAHRASNQLFEMWRANLVGGELFGGCVAVWDMKRLYSPSGRGENCTSADAAGLPIAPLLFTADEVAAGSIDHAIRFILPNDRIREEIYVHPATHSTGATSGPESAPPYGIRFRLRADYPLENLPNEGARAVARAVQRYGMFLADGGQVALTAQSDRFTNAKWSGVLESRDLELLQVSDFEVVAAGQRFVYTGDCVRLP